MTTALEPPLPMTAHPPNPVTWEEELFRLQLRVARRADVLAGFSRPSRGRDLQIWFQAEWEILGEKKSGAPVSAATAA